MWEWLSDRLLHDGILVRALTDPDERALKDVASALDVVKRVDPRTYRLAARLLEGGVVVAPPREATGWYDVRRKACILNYDYVTTASYEDMALTIVHETCHARLMNCGIGYEEALRFRVEQVCQRRELAFARLLVAQDPEGFDYVSYMRKRIDSLSPDTLSNDDFRQSNRRSKLRELRHLKALGAPRFIRRWAVLMIRRRRQRDQRRAKLGRSA